MCCPLRCGLCARLRPKHRGYTRVIGRRSRRGVASLARRRRRPMPATVAAYLTALVEQLSAGALARRAAAITAQHRQHGLASPVSDPDVTTLLWHARRITVNREPNAPSPSGASLGACPVRALKDWMEATDSRFGRCFERSIAGAMSSTASPSLEWPSSSPPFGVPPQARVSSHGSSTSTVWKRMSFPCWRCRPLSRAH
jgi:hypothetical protein